MGDLMADLAKVNFAIHTAIARAAFFRGGITGLLKIISQLKASPDRGRTQNSPGATDTESSSATPY